MVFPFERVAALLALIRPSILVHRLFMREQLTRFGEKSAANITLVLLSLA